jgi:hypothetical protein
MPTLNLAAVAFAVDVALLAEGLLGESAGPDGPDDGCPHDDPRCWATSGLTTPAAAHQTCEHVWAVPVAAATPAQAVR